MPIWISHRGVREGNVVENTKESFSAAIRKGFKVLETDLRITADHHIVLAHDIDLARVGRDERPLVKLTRAQIEAIRFPDGQSPYFLDEFMNDCAKQTWVFDVKPETSCAALAILARMLKDRPRVEIARKISFVVWNKADETYVGREFPGARVFARERECWRAGLSFLYLGGFASGVRPGRTYSIVPQVHGQKLFTKAFVQNYQKLGGRVVAFLPRTEEEARAAVIAGCDEILSDGWLLK